MVVHKHDPEISLTLVMGAPMVGKSTWCKEQQVKLPNIFIIPYNDMLYALRGNYNVIKPLYTIVANVVYDQVWALSDMTKHIHILVDGFNESISDIERFAQITNKFSIFHLFVPDLMTIRRNAMNKSEGKPFYSTSLPDKIYNTKKFFISQEFKALVKHYDVTYTTFNPSVKQSVIAEIENSVK